MERPLPTAFTGAFWGAASGYLNYISADEDLVASLFKHSFTQGGMDALQGGNMIHGFMMGAISSSGGYLINENAKSLGRIGEVAANSILSGTVEEIGGGKFANGAITGAFAILFNDMMHQSNGKNESIHNELASAFTIIGGTLLTDDISAIGVLDDPIAFAFLFCAAGIECYEQLNTIRIVKEQSVLQASEHTKNQRPSTRQKHTKRRAGMTYGSNRNDNRGNKNKKRQHPINPNKRK